MLDFMIATPKMHILARNRVFWHILRQNRSRGLGCSELQEPKKTEKTSRVNTFGAQSHACAETKPLGGSWRTFAYVYGSNFYDCRFGVWAWWGSNFRFLHWLASSPLQHSRTTGLLNGQPNAFSGWRGKCPCLGDGGTASPRFGLTVIFCVICVLLLCLASLQTVVYICVSRDRLLKFPWQQHNTTTTQRRYADSG